MFRRACVLPLLTACTSPATADIILPGENLPLTTGTLPPGTVIASLESVSNMTSRYYPSGGVLAHVSLTASVVQSSAGTLSFLYQLEGDDAPANPYRQGIGQWTISGFRGRTVDVRRLGQSDFAPDSVMRSGDGDILTFYGFNVEYRLVDELSSHWELLNNPFLVQGNPTDTLLIITDATTYAPSATSNTITQDILRNYPFATEEPLWETLLSPVTTLAPGPIPEPASAALLLPTLLLLRRSRYRSKNGIHERFV